MLGRCPNCGNKFEIQPEWINKVSECPYCHQQIIIEADISQASPGEIPRIAGLGERFLALFIDGMLLGVVNFIASVLFIAISAVLLQSASDSTSATMLSAIPQAMSSIFGCLVGMAYEAFFLSQYGATPGKMIFKIRVQYKGQNPSVARSIGRYWARSISGFCCCLGYILAFFNPEHKALHDTVCDTIVVKQG